VFSRVISLLSLLFPHNNARVTGSSPLFAVELKVAIKSRKAPAHSVGG
jgi:hypothetical protein